MWFQAFLLLPLVMYFIKKKNGSRKLSNTILKKRKIKQLVILYGGDGAQICVLASLHTLEAHLVQHRLCFPFLCRSLIFTSTANHFFFFFFCISLFLWSDFFQIRPRTQIIRRTDGTVFRVSTSLSIRRLTGEQSVAFFSLTYNLSTCKTCILPLFIVVSMN